MEIQEVGSSAEERPEQVSRGLSETHDRWALYWLTAEQVVQAGSTLGWRCRWGLRLGD